MQNESKIPEDQDSEKSFIFLLIFKYSLFLKETSRKSIPVNTYAQRINYRGKRSQTA